MQTIEPEYLDIANAIVAQAAEDYRKALNGISYCKNKSPDECIEELETFFRSNWYRTLTKVDSEYLMEQIKKEHFEENRKEKQ